MLRRYQSLLGKLYIVLDAIAAMLALVVAWLIRFKLPLFPQYHALSFTMYMSVMPASVVAFLLAAGFLGLYGTTRSSSIRTIAFQQAKSVVAMIIAISLVLYFYKLGNYSRSVTFMAGALAWVFSVSARLAVRMMMRMLRNQGFNRKFILVVGLTTTTGRLLQQLKDRKEMGYHVIGYLDADVVGTDGAHRVYLSDNIPCLGSVHDLDAVLANHIVDHLILTLPNNENDRILSVMEIAESHGVHALLIPSFIDILPNRPRFDEFAGVPIVDTRYTPLDDAVNLVLKRTFDIVFSILVLVIGSPLFLFIAILVKLSSTGSVIYSQERVGRNRRTFQMYKFRTMYCEDSSTMVDEGWTVANDPRRTPFGRILRRTSLDELPQFVNVLRGDMSVIGPRPERTLYVDQFREDIPRYMIKHRIRPGITGWAQVNGLRGDTSISDRIEYDLRYIENWSFTWDMRIVLLTIWKGFRNRNAY